MATSSNFPSTVSSSDRIAGNGDIAWTNPGNVSADDGSNATCSVASTGYTEELRCSNFGFSLAADARITGLQVEVQGQVDDGITPFYMHNVELSWSGYSTSLDRAADDTAAWSTTERTVTYGSSSEYNWGLPLNKDVVNDSNFGCKIRFSRSGSTSKQMQIDYVKIILTYDTTGGREYDSTADACIAQIQMFEAAASGTFRTYFPKLGTLKAIFVMANSALLTGRDSTRSFTNTNAHVRMSQGAATGSTARWMGCTRYRNNVSSFSAGRRNNADSIAMVMNSSSNSTLQFELDISSFGADYVEWDVATNNAVDNRWGLTIIAFGGSGVSAAVGVEAGGDGTINETVDITSPGFEPDLVITSSGMELYNDSTTHTFYAGTGTGFCYNPGTGDVNLVQRGCIWESETTPTNTESQHRVDETYLHYNINPQEVETYYAKCKTFDSSGFSVEYGGDDGTDSGGDDGFGWLALSGFDNYQVGTLTTPTSAASKTFGNADLDPDIGFTPSFVMLVGGRAQAVDTTYDAVADAGIFGVSAFSEMNEGCMSLAAEDGVSTSDAESTLATDAVVFHDDDGTTLFDATFDTFTSTGFTLDFTGGTSGTARKWIYLALGPSGAAPPAALPPGSLSTLGAGI